MAPIRFLPFGKKPAFLRGPLPLSPSHSPQRRNGRRVCSAFAVAAADTTEDEVKAAIWAVERASRPAGRPAGGGTTQLIIGDRWAERPPTMNFQTDEGEERERERERGREGRKAKKWIGRGILPSLLYLAWQGLLEAVADHPQREQNFRCSNVAGIWQQHPPPILRLVAVSYSSDRPNELKH